MFVLERRVFQGTEVCPQYRWKQYALCGSQSLLERVRSAQRRPEDWRVAALACDSLPLSHTSRDTRKIA